jgi:hypothetical protein
MNTVSLIALISLTFLVGLFYLVRPRRRPASDEAFSNPGFSVELDCRMCGQFNRVPSSRLRDRSKCGRCKARLMPGRHVVLCRVSRLNASLLGAIWRDEDRLWQCLADHVARETKERAETPDVHSREVY